MHVLVIVCHVEQSPHTEPKAKFRSYLSPSFEKTDALYVYVEIQIFINLMISASEIVIDLGHVLT